jgi:hypothetical protein
MKDTLDFITQLLINPGFYFFLLIVGLFLNIETAVGVWVVVFFISLCRGMYHLIIND